MLATGRSAKNRPHFSLSQLLRQLQVGGSSTSSSSSGSSIIHTTSFSGSHNHHRSRQLHTTPSLSRKALHKNRPSNTDDSSSGSSALRFGAPPESSEDEVWREQRRQDRTTDKLLHASKLGLHPPRAPTGSDAYAGWKTSLGSSSRRNVGRPKLNPRLAQDQFAARMDDDIDALLGSYTASILNRPIHPTISRSDAEAQNRLGLVDFLYPSRELQPGDFVELRKHGSTLGIVLPPPENERDLGDKATSSSSSTPSSSSYVSASGMAQGEIFVLVSSGVIALYRDTDVTMQIPRVVERQLTHRAAALSRDFVATSNSADMPPTQDGGHDAHQAGSSSGLDPAEGVAAVEEPVDEPRFEARASICNKLRILERQKEREMQRLFPAFRSLFLSPESQQQSGKVDRDRMDLKTGTITTYEATRLMNDHVSRLTTAEEDEQSAVSGAPITASTMLAGHSLLMNTPSQFIADPSSHRTSQLFTCRSVEEQHTLRLLTKWCQSPPGSEGQRYIDAFCEKARRLRAYSSAHPYDPEGPPRRIDSPELDVEWTEQDRLILSFLQASLGSRRELQDDTHGSIAMELIKRAGAHLRAKPHPIDKDVFDATWAAKTVLFPANDAAVDPDRGASAPEGAAEVDPYDFSILTSLAFEIYAGPDLQHALVTLFLKEIGALPPWHNPLLLDASFRNLVSGEDGGRPEAHAPKASLDAGAFRHRYDDAIESMRHDFGPDLPVYVIDDAGAFELDDGISIEPAGGEGQYWVHVHVADPTASIRPGDKLADRAQRRFSTLYFPEARWALLPDSFVNSGVGIRKPLADDDGSDGGNAVGQRVFTFSAKVDVASGRVDDFKVRPGWIRNVQILSYERVNELLRTGGHADLAKLRDVASALCASRVRGTALTAWRRSASVHVAPLPLPALSAVPDAGAAHPQFYAGAPRVDVSVTAVQADPTRHAAQFLVAELMVLAGRIAGTFGETHDVPLPYRLQARPTDATQLARIMAMKDAQTGLLDFERMLALDLTIPVGRYSDRAGEHFSLGVGGGEGDGAGTDGGESGVVARGGYIRATSPLRRYPDMVAHWQIKAALAGRAPPLDRTALRTRRGAFERSEMLVKQLHRATARAWVVQAVEAALQRERDGRARAEDARLLGPYEAVAILTDVRVSAHTLAARVRVQVDGLGMPADLVWPLPAWGQPKNVPHKGQRFTVKVVATVMAGLRCGVVVQAV